MSVVDGIRVTCTNAIILAEATAQLRRVLAEKYPGKTLPSINCNLIYQHEDYKPTSRMFDIVVLASKLEYYDSHDVRVNGYSETDLSFGSLSNLDALVERVNLPRKRQRSSTDSEMSAPKRQRILDDLAAAARLIEHAVDQFDAPEAEGPAETAGPEEADKPTA